MSYGDDDDDVDEVGEDDDDDDDADVTLIVGEHAVYCYFGRNH